MNRNTTNLSTAWIAKQTRLANWTGLKISNLSIKEFRWTAVAIVVASNSDRHPEWSSVWRKQLFNALQFCRNRNYLVLFSPNNKIGFWIAQFAKRFQTDIMQLQIQNARLEDHTTGKVHSMSLCAVPNTADTTNETLRSLPILDRSLFALADKVIALDVHRGSKTERLLQHWIGESPETHANLIVADSNFEKASELHRDLRFTCLPDFNSNEPTNTAMVDYQWHCAARRISDQASELQSLWVRETIWRSSTWNSEKYLIHCTRSRGGPFPLQSIDGYATELIVHEQDLSAQPIESLKRILIDQRIVATAQLKREGIPSVSFSNVPLRELLDRRRYRKHLKRWDWEPYGIAIQKESLIAKSGACPVHYCPAGNPPANVPAWLYQPSTSQDGVHRWEDEREWRAPTDVRLSMFVSTEVFVFVSNRREAAQLTNLSRFPIAVVSE